MNSKILGIDLAKSVFQICLLNDMKIVFNKKVSRNRLLDSIRNIEPGTRVAMEACSSAHYWGREIGKLGFQVCLIPPQHVKAFVKNHKNDAHDALAICEAANRPNIHFVPVKSIHQQDVCVLHNIRQSIVQRRVAISNQIRGLASEYGLIFPQQMGPLKQHLLEALEDAENGLSPIARQVLYQLYDQWLALMKQENELEKSIASLSSQSPTWDMLQTVPGIGPIISSAMVGYIGDGKQFKNGRQMAAWLGLVPRQASSGGKNQLGRITKSGNRYLRSILIHGARAALQRRELRNDRLGGWMKSLVQRRGFNKACVAYANKCARMCWSILAKKEPFAMDKAFV